MSRSGDGERLPCPPHPNHLLPARQEGKKVPELECKIFLGPQPVVTYHLSSIAIATSPSPIIGYSLAMIMTSLKHHQPVTVSRERDGTTRNKAGIIHVVRRHAKARLSAVVLVCRPTSQKIHAQTRCVCVCVCARNRCGDEPPPPHGHTLMQHVLSFFFIARP
jgi:hypothetical protein